MTRHIFELWQIHIDQFFNVVESIHSSWLFPSRMTLVIRFVKTNSLICRSLGLLNCIRIWHDNSGAGSLSSWFLKYIIIRDLQTMEKFHFICQRWFAVEKDDGRVRSNCLYCDSIFIREKSRSNVFCLLLVKWKNVNFLIFYPNMLITVFPIVIYGCRSFLVHYRINLLVFNDAPVVSSYSSFPCF